MAEKDKAEGKETATESGINPKWLEGLSWSGATPKEVTENGLKKIRYSAFERPLEPADVMSWKDCGATVAIATTDGKKHIVPKKKKTEK